MNEKYKNLDHLLSTYSERVGLQEVQFELGVDEAGRGPVFGSMIYSALWWPTQMSAPLAQIGFEDSKQLSQQKRQQLFQKINYMKGKMIFYELEQLTALRISNNMLNQQNSGRNLNQLSHEAALKLIKKALDAQFNIKCIYVDTVGDADKYRQYLWRGLEQYKCIKDIIVTPKADQRFKVVSAASICAKVTRDKIINNWKFTQNLNFVGNLGSGYPGDPKTKQWLQKNKHPVFGYPTLVRMSWATAMNALEKDLVLQIKRQQQTAQLKSMNWFKVKNKEKLLKDLWDVVQQ